MDCRRRLCEDESFGCADFCSLPSDYNLFARRIGADCAWSLRFGRHLLHAALCRSSRGGGRRVQIFSGCARASLCVQKPLFLRKFGLETGAAPRFYARKLATRENRRQVTRARLQTLSFGVLLVAKSAVYLHLHGVKRGLDSTLNAALNLDADNNVSLLYVISLAACGWIFAFFVSGGRGDDRGGRGDNCRRSSAFV